MTRKGNAFKISVDKTEGEGLILRVEIILNWVLRKNIYKYGIDLSGLAGGQAEQL